MANPEPLYLDMIPEDPDACPGKGYLGAEYAIVGIAPSPNRPLHRINEPFGAKSYKLLQAILDIMGHTNVYVTNLKKTPLQPGTKMANYEASYYYPILVDELRLMGVSRRVLALGVPVAEVLCPGFKSMRDDHGTIFWNPELKLHVMPTYHLSAIGRDPGLLPNLKRDLERFATMPDPVEPDVILFPDDPAEFRTVLRQWLDDRDFELEVMVTEDRTQEIIIDIETTGLDLMTTQITRVGLGRPTENVARVMYTPTPELLCDLMRILKEYRVKLIGHNIAFDLARLIKHSGVSWLQPVEDTLLLAHTTGEPQLGLKHLTTKYTDRPGSRAFGGFESLGYLGEDVLSTRDLYHHFTHKRPRTPVQDLLGRLVPVFASMEVRGVYIEPDLIEELTVWAHHQVRESYEKLMEETDHDGAGTRLVNWNAPLQVAKLFEEMGIPLTQKTDSGNYSVNEAAILPLREDYQVVDSLLTYREAQKQVTFLETYRIMTEEDGCLHPSLRLFGTDTGRLSCRDPNLQQVTRIGPLKTLFVPRWPGGSIALCDLAQAELRVAALLSGDEHLAEALNSGDVHLTIASQIFQRPPEQVTAAQRKKSKGVTFGLLYGGSEKGLAQRVGVPLHEVTEVVNGFYYLFSKLTAWIERIGDFGIEERYVTTPMGRYRSLDWLYRNEGANSVKRKAINTPIQGTASDLMLLVLDYFARQLVTRKLKSRPLFTVHDSLIIEVYPGEEFIIGDVLHDAFRSLNDVKELTSLPLWGQVPIMGELKIGPNWATVESTNENYDPSLPGRDMSSTT